MFRTCVFIIMHALIEAYRTPEISISLWLPQKRRNSISRPLLLTHAARVCACVCVWAPKNEIYSWSVEQFSFGICFLGSNRDMPELNWTKLMTRQVYRSHYLRNRSLWFMRNRGGARASKAFENGQNDKRRYQNCRVHFQPGGKNES